ncbi:MAG TPA: asparaginase [Candidatus Dormibacteraeota bacterium]|jgi:L-asparaginase II|nr:asparaginase [Candidatus Dormibacteraeota bacterium]
MPTSAVPLIRVERGGVEEALHLGHVVVADAAGQVQAAAGNVDRLTFYRSCAKPFQAFASISTDIIPRFGLQSEHVAIMAASHNGEPRHVEVVRDLLQRVGLPESALQCGAHWPYYEPAAAVLRHEMSEPLAVFNNCSGKHAGMLAAARALAAPFDSYLDPGHPVQRRIRDAISVFTGCPADEVHYGIDGCSAPNAAVPLRAMARSFAAFIRSDDSSARLIVEAMTTQPFLVGGTDRFDTRLMEVTHGRLLTKGGAAGAHCTADRRSGLGLAVKLDSGDGTWTPVAVMAALEQLGWIDATEAQALSSFASPNLKNHRRVVVGSVRPVLQLPVTAV